MKTLTHFLVGLVASASFLASPGHCAVADGQINFTSLVHRQHAGLHPDEPGLKTYVIENFKEWTDIWQQLTADRIPSPAVPKVDFDTHIIVGVISGFDTGGYTLTINTITQKNDFLLVDVLQRSAGEDCRVALSFTEPHHFVMVPRLDQPVEFSLQHETYHCSQ